MSLGSLFAQGTTVTPNFSTANTYSSALNSIASGLGNQASTLTNSWNADNGQLQGAINGYSNYLKQNSGTNTQDAAFLSNAENGASEAAARAGANAMVGEAARGISPNSSIAAGTAANIAQGLGSTDANARMQLGEAQVQQNAENKATLANLWNGQTNTAFGEQQDVNAARTSDYNTLYGQQYQQAMANYNVNLQNQQSQQAARAQQLNAIGSAVGSYFGAPPTS